MTLVELFFCIVFLALPVAGMMGLVIDRVMKGSRKVEASKEIEAVEEADEQPVSTAPVFENERVMRYQFVESVKHVPLRIHPVKEGFHSRDGPLSSHMNSFGLRC